MAMLFTLLSHDHTGSNQTPRDLISLHGPRFVLPGNQRHEDSETRRDCRHNFAVFDEQGIELGHSELTETAVQIRSAWSQGRE